MDEQSGHGDGIARRKRAASDPPNNENGAINEAESEDEIPPAGARLALLPSGGKVSVRVDTKVTDEKFDSFKQKHQCTYVDSVPTLSDGYLMNLVERKVLEARAESSHRSSRKFEDAQLMHMPLLDGGLRTACVNPPTVVPSLKEKCLSAELCAFCMETLPQKLKSAQKSKKSKTGNAKFDVDAGSVCFRVHPVCYQALERNNMFKHMTSMSVKGINAYGDSDEDINCDLCTRSGGLLFLFDFSESRINNNPPRDTGWLAHAPCLHWLDSTGILRRRGTNYAVAEPPNLPQRSDLREVEVVLSDLVNEVVMRCHERELDEDGDYSVLRDGRTSSPSNFHRVIGRWRCSLCSSWGGVTSRCAAIGCTVRSHFLCATISRWYIFRTTSTDREQLSPSAGFLCPKHCCEHPTT